MIKITAIIQARTGSSRFPQKVMCQLSGKTMLERVVERAMRAKSVEEVVVAIPDTEENDVLADLCKDKGFSLYRGSHEDVLDRYYQAAMQVNAQHIIRITADCPLIDPKIIDIVSDTYIRGAYDYVSTGRMSSTYPDGLDVEIFSFEALQTAWKKAKLLSEREHVTPYIWKQPDIFAVTEVQHSKDLSHLRWTVDEEEDITFIRFVYDYFKDKPFFMNDVLQLSKKYIDEGREKREYNRNEGYLESLQEDADTLPRT